MQPPALKNRGETRRGLSLVIEPLLPGCLAVYFPVTPRDGGLFLLRAALVCNGAAGFASALTRALALAATAVFKRLLQTGLRNGLEMFHWIVPPLRIRLGLF
jgi:hypothetical protein